MCGQIRSAGYHRHNPIIPGQALVSTRCRRCKKRARKNKEKAENDKARQKGMSRPSENLITIKIDNSERRGRTRTREVHQVYRDHSSSPEIVVYRSRSRVKIGTGEPTYNAWTTENEVSSGRMFSPHTRRATRTEIRFQSVSPHPDGLRARSRPQENREQQHDSSLHAKSRLATHPTAYRTFTPTEMPGYYPDETPSPRSPPPRGILKVPPRFFELQPDRYQMEATPNSMLPEVGGNRVHFGREPKPAERMELSRTQCSTCGSIECVCFDDQTSHNRLQYHFRRRHNEEIVSPELPTQKLGQLHVRDESPPRAFIRDTSHHGRRDVDEVNFRHVHARTGGNVREGREVSARQGQPAEADRLGNYRPHGGAIRIASPLMRAEYDLRGFDNKVRQSFSASPPSLGNRRHEDWDDATDSGSELSTEHYRVNYHHVDKIDLISTVHEKRSRPPFPAPDVSTTALPSNRKGDGPAITRGFTPMRYS